MIFFLSINFLITGCQTGSDKKPPISFNKYEIADGFGIQLAASEPLNEAPVALDFNNKYRMWVVEMRGFMPNIAGTGEDQALRVSKSDLQTRPILHFQEEQIKLHLFICFMALAVSKDIELKTQISIRAFLTKCKKIYNAIYSTKSLKRKSG